MADDRDIANDEETGREADDDMIGQDVEEFEELEDLDEEAEEIEKEK